MSEIQSLDQTKHLMNIEEEDLDEAIESNESFSDVEERKRAFTLSTV